MIIYICLWECVSEYKFKYIYNLQWKIKIKKRNLLDGLNILKEVKRKKKKKKGEERRKEEKEGGKETID